MSARASPRSSNEGGFGIVEVMVGLVISMLVVMIILQAYQVSEGRKRTITAGSDAQQSAIYGLYVLGQDLSMAGNVIATSATALSGCAAARPIPVTVSAGATDNDPDTVTVFYGGSPLPTPTPFLTNAVVGNSPPDAYQVSGPAAFSTKDLIVAVQGTNCTLSTINSAGISVSPTSGIATISHTPTSTPGNNTSATYSAVTASLVNLGQPGRFGRILYSVDPTNATLTTQSLLPTAQQATAVVADVVNLKAMYGLDTDSDGTVDTWQPATGIWSAANLPSQPLATWQQIRAVRVAIVTRSETYETGAVTPGPLGMFCSPSPCALSMTLTDDEQHYRYKVLETIVPLRNAIWNAS